MSNSKVVDSIINKLKSGEFTPTKEECFSLGIFLEAHVVELEKLANKLDSLKFFYAYFAELHGQGLEVANWHMNGDLEPFDSFFDSAEEVLNHQ